MKEILRDSLIQGTMEEFVRTDGQYMIMTKIPIKKTIIHNELKKQTTFEEKEKDTNKEFDDFDKTTLSMSSTNIQTKNSLMTNSASPVKNRQPRYQQEEVETPQQRAQRRKMEEIQQKEAKMRQAARDAFTTRDQAKQRKNLELYGSIQNEAGGQSQDFNLDTLKSENFNPRNSGWGRNTVQTNFSAVSNMSAFEKNGPQYDPVIQV